MIKYAINVENLRLRLTQESLHTCDSSSYESRVPDLEQEFNQIKNGDKAPEHTKITITNDHP